MVGGAEPDVARAVPVLRACGIPAARIRFQHGAINELPDGLLLADSYHVSRYNTNTGLLTQDMFEQAVLTLRPDRCLVLAA